MSFLWSGEIEKNEGLKFLLRMANFNPSILQSFNPFSNEFYGFDVLFLVAIMATYSAQLFVDQEIC